MKRAYWVPVLVLAMAAGCSRGERPAVWEVTPSLVFHAGAVNGAVISRGGETVAVYRDPRKDAPPARHLLLTHHRRDVVWAAREGVRRGSAAVAPAAEIGYFTGVADFWQRFQTERWHDYAQQSTKILAEPLEVGQTVRGGESLRWQDLVFEVLDTPGFTRGAVSYLAAIDGKRVAFTGDLIYGDGQIFDLYSLQDAIPEANTRGYHGYAARAADVIASLRKLIAAQPDLIVPARGPVIENPEASARKLIARLEELFATYFQTDALRWYWGDDNLMIRARRVLGDREIDFMPMARSIRQTLPRWILARGTSRLLVSESGAAFLLDCGTQQVLEWLRDLRRRGVFQKLDGIYITHYHDDHTDWVQATRTEFQVPVYSLTEVKDILENPEAHHMPAQTPNAIRPVEAMEEGTKMRWNEFRFEFTYFPGQAIYHGGLMVEHDSGEKYFFVGDSFSPSGLDDYCLLNRHLLHPGLGHFLCLRKIEAAGPGYDLVNQHIEPTFRYGPEQMRFMREALERKRRVIGELVPWDDPNYGTDEQWSRFYPYSLRAKAGEPFELSAVVYNHSGQPRQFGVKPRAPKGWQASAAQPVVCPPREQATVRVTVTPPAGARGLAILTADVGWGDRKLGEWIEAMVTVE
jgi:glyoxylase-like metal-dependent hydrolase (beta-lactamase superfamily II)